MAVYWTYGYECRKREFNFKQDSDISKNDIEFLKEECNMKELAEYSWTRDEMQTKYEIDPEAAGLPPYGGLKLYDIMKCGSQRYDYYMITQYNQNDPDKEKIVAVGDNIPELIAYGISKTIANNLKNNDIVVTKDGRIALEKEERSKRLNADYVFKIGALVYTKLLDEYKDNEYAEFLY